MSQILELAYVTLVLGLAGWRLAVRVLSGNLLNSDWAFIDVPIILIGFLQLREVIRESVYRSKALKHGCGLPKTNLQRPFGLIQTIRVVQAVRANNLLNVIRQGFLAQGSMTVRNQVMGRPTFVTIDPENVKTMLATNFKSYSLGLRQKQLGPMLGHGIFVSEGAHWKNSRAILRPQFVRERISQLRQLDVHIDRLIAIFKANSLKDEYSEFAELYSQMTLDSATEFLFGQSLETLTNKDKILVSSRGDLRASDFAKAYPQCIHFLANRARMGSLYFLMDSFKFRRNLKVCHKFVDALVEENLARVDRKEKSDDANHSPSLVEDLSETTRDPLFLRDAVFSSLLAGRNSTSALMTFAMWFLSHDERVWQKLRNIVLEEFGTDHESITFEGLRRCTYVGHVLNEVLRLCPLVPLNYRSAVEDTTLPRGGGPNEDQPLFIPKGTQVIYGVYIMHRYKKFWGDDAEEFRPERWADGTHHSWDYLPFNGGPRICLGQQFALTEVSYTLVRLLQSFSELEIPPLDRSKPLAQEYSLSARVLGGVRVKFKQ